MKLGNTHQADDTESERESNDDVVAYSFLFHTTMLLI